MYYRKGAKSAKGLKKPGEDSYIFNPEFKTLACFALAWLCMCRDGLRGSN
jgi:hypothetical protein